MENKIEKDENNTEKDRYNNIILDQEEITTPTQRKNLFSFLKKLKVEKKEQDEVAENTIDELFGYVYGTTTTDKSTEDTIQIKNAKRKKKRK